VSVLMYGYMYMGCFYIHAPMCVFAESPFFVAWTVTCNFCVFSRNFRFLHNVYTLFEDLHGFVAQNHTKSWEVMKGCHYASLLIGRIVVCFGSKRWYLFFTSRPECPGMGPFMCIGVLRSHSSPD
jgi:hypothetical protein